MDIIESGKLKNIILDLDETLIHCIGYDEMSDDELDKRCDKYTPERCESNVHSIVDLYEAYERPGLQKFLTFLFANFNVSVWTAASKDYACEIVDKILIGEHGNSRKLDFIFFSYHCKLAKKEKKNMKCLSIVWDIFETEGYDETNTIIIDDNDLVYKDQEKNCIHIKPFDIFEDINKDDDIELKKIEDMLSKQIK